MTFPQKSPLLLINKLPIIQLTSALLALNHLPPVALPRCMFNFILNSLSLHVLFFLFCAFSGMMNIFSSSWNTVVEETCQGLFTVEEAYQKQLPDDSYDNQVRQSECDFIQHWCNIYIQLEYNSFPQQCTYSLATTNLYGI